MLVDKDRTPADITRVNLAETWEVQYWCTKYGCTEEVLRHAVGEVGPTSAEVERKLGVAAKQALKNTGED